MKVFLELETINEQGETELENMPAILEKQDKICRLKYLQKVSDNDEYVNTEMIFTSKTMRMKRTGILESDLIYENGLVHNSLYHTPFGALPMTLETKNYSVVLKTAGEEAGEVEDLQLENINDEFEINMSMKYDLIVAEQEPLYMQVNVKVTRRK